MINPYKILGVHRGTVLEDIKAAYKKKMWNIHPDRGGDTDAAAEITEAYALLYNKKQLKQHLDELSVIGEFCLECSGKGYKYKQRSLTERVLTSCFRCGGQGLTMRGE